MDRRTLVVLGTALVTSLPSLGRAQELDTASWERGWIGVRFDLSTVTGPGAGRNPPSSAILITEVYRSGPADLGGLLPGDRVLTVDGRSLPTYDAWMRYLANVAPGQTLRLRLDRNNREQEATIVVGPRPSSMSPESVLDRAARVRERLFRSIDSLLEAVVADGQENGLRFRSGVFPRGLLQADSELVQEGSEEDSLSRFPMAEGQVLNEGGLRPAAADEGPAWSRGSEDSEWPRLLSPYILEGSFILGGARARSLTEELGHYFGVPSGVLLTDVINLSPAWRAGLRPGDVIVSADDRSLATVAELRGVLAGTPVPFELTVIRRGTTRRLWYPRPRQ